MNKHYRLMFNSKVIGVIKTCICFLTSALVAFDSEISYTFLSLSLNFLIIKILIIVTKPGFIVTFERKKSHEVLSGRISWMLQITASSNILKDLIVIFFR